jgi:transposase-like protein
MTMKPQQLRDEITRSRAGQDRWRCPSALRKRIIEFAEQGRREGVSVARLADQVGLSASGLRRWLERGAGVLRPVRVQEASPASPSLVLVTPGGFRLEGLDASSAIDVLRRLAC